MEGSLSMICLLTLYNILGGGAAAGHVTFHLGYKYDYFFKAETEIMGMDNLTTEIQVRSLLWES